MKKRFDVLMMAASEAKLEKAKTERAFIDARTVGVWDGKAIIDEDGEFVELPITRPRHRLSDLVAVVKRAVALGLVIIGDPVEDAEPPV